jgi:hypothetical protein
MALPPIGPHQPATPPAAAQQPPEIGPENFLGERTRRCPSAQWAGLMIENPVMRGLYRMYTPKVNFDADLLECARKLDRADATVYYYYLKVIWRALMQNYAIIDALKVGNDLRRAGESAWWSVWRFVQGYSLPRLWVAFIIGYIPLLGSDRLRYLLADLSAQAGPRSLALAAICVLIFYLGMSDVQQHVGRAWGRVLRGLLAFSVTGRRTRALHGGFISAAWL